MYKGSPRWQGAAHRCGFHHDGGRRLQIKYRKHRPGRHYLLLPGSWRPSGMRKATLGNLSYQHPLREEEHTAWRGLARQGPLTAAFGDSRQHSRSATPPLSHCPPQSTAGGSAPGRCIHEPPWAAPQRGSRRGAPLGPRSRAGCGEPALHHGMPSAPLSPAGPPSPASSYRKHRDKCYIKRWGGKTTQQCTHT